MTTVWSFPTRVVFGDGSIESIADEAKGLNANKILIVADPGVVEAGLVETVQKSLVEGGLEVVVFDQISSNPLEKELTAATQAVARRIGIFLCCGFRQRRRGGRRRRRRQPTRRREARAGHGDAPEPRRPI